MAVSLEAQLGTFGISPSAFLLEPWESCSSRWTKWLERFEIYLVAMDIKDEYRKKALLLLFAGEEVHSLYSTLPHQRRHRVLQTSPQLIRKQRFHLIIIFFPNGTKNLKFIPSEMQFKGRMKL